MTMKITPVHPGAYLGEVLEDLDLSARRFVNHIGVSPMRISYILRAKRPISAELAVLFAKALGTSAQYWMNLQTHYDLATTEDNPPEQYAQVTPLFG